MFWFGPSISSADISAIHQDYSCKGSLFSSNNFIVAVKIPKELIFKKIFLPVYFH